MKKLIEQVREFHQATGSAIYEGEPPSMELRGLRARMLSEEVDDEYAPGVKQGDVLEQVDGAGDALYLLSGDCVAYGWGCALPLAASEWRAMSVESAHALYRKHGRAYLDDLAGAAIQALVALGYHPRKVTDEISASNMSKLLKHERDEIETAKVYDLIGVTIEYRGTYPTRAAISAQDQEGADGKHYPKGKVLKSVYWRKPDFTGCRI